MPEPLPLTGDLPADPSADLQAGLNADLQAAAAAGTPADAPRPAQPRNPLHGVTLEAIVKALVAHYGWPGLADRIALRCFVDTPSVPSTLKLLRKTPWAREKVESLYLYMLREQRRSPVPPAGPQQAR